MSEAKLCPNCSKLKIHLLPKYSAPGFKISTLKDLFLNQQHCSLCRILWIRTKSEQEFLSDGKLNASHSHKPVILTRFIGDSSKSSQDGLKMSRFDVRIGESQARDISLYSPEGSPAVLRNDIIQRDISFAPMAPSPCTLIRRRLDECLSKHNECSVSFSGQKLPDNNEDWPVQACRLIQVSPGNDRDQTLKTRLVKTSNQAFRPYVALSHCWGSLERRPLRTLKENLQRHLHDIPWQSLPKTFQEACAICAQLGIEYIWIDSLCIVQDDSAEWEAESAIMGRIYEESLFNIAASSAADSSEGLFDVLEKIDFVKIPYTGPEGLEDSSVYAYLQQPGLHIDRDATPLNARAWVMQEAILSRRTVHFTKHGLIWSCSMGSLQEGNNRATPRLNVVDWLELAMRYSGRDLTYQSDKLHAIQGLANESAKRHRKTYYYGVFIEDLAASLRWFGDNERPIHRTVLEGVGNILPSWSWASVTGRIEFLRPHVCQEEEFVCGNLRALGSGLLGLEAPLKSIERLFGPFPWELHLGFYIEELRMVNLGQEVKPFMKHSPHMLAKRFVLLDASQARIGWCCFEVEKAQTKKIFFMAIHRQKVRDWWMPQKETEEKSFIWGLVLSRRESTSAFERVGYAHIMDTTWIVNQPLEDIVLM